MVLNSAYKTLIFHVMALWKSMTLYIVYVYCGGVKMLIRMSYQCPVSKKHYCTICSFSITLCKVWSQNLKHGFQFPGDVYITIICG